MIVYRPLKAMFIVLSCKQNALYMYARDLSFKQINYVVLNVQGTDPNESMQSRCVVKVGKGKN